jgi:hypothetical protein
MMLLHAIDANQELRQVLSARNFPFTFPGAFTWLSDVDLK